MSDIIDTDVEGLKKSAFDFKKCVTEIDNTYKMFLSSLEKFEYEYNMGKNKYDNYEANDEIEYLRRKYFNLKEVLQNEYNILKNNNFMRSYDMLIDCLDEYHKK